MGMTIRPTRLGAARSLELAGVAAAVVLAVVVNVLAGRHFTRWDWTTSRRWSITPATQETLRTLEQPVELWTIVGRGDPLEISLRELLAAYASASPRVEIHWIDPDRDAVEIVDLQRRFGLEAGRAEDGRVATDAVVLVSSGDKHWFLTREDMFEQADDVHVKPGEERALTRAIRSVLGGDRSRLCFTAGHGELSLDSEKDPRESLAGVRDLLEKNNYELTRVDLNRRGPAPSAAGAEDPLEGCDVVVLAGPRAPFSPAETSLLRTWLLAGGSLFAAVGPTETSSDTGLGPAGLDAALTPFGIALDDDVVHDVNPDVAIPDTHGEGFFVTARAHAVTASLVAGTADAHRPRVATFFARSLRHVSSPESPPPSLAVDLLVTTDGAYAKTSIAGASSWTDAPARDPSDRGGPLVIAMAGERSRPTAASSHGSRVVVVGSRFAFADDNWRQPRVLRGAAYFVDGALAWLAARPNVLDVPERAEVAVGMHVSEQGRSDVRRYVLVLMPLAALLLGIAVWAWRRSAENTPYVPVLQPAAANDKPSDGKGARR
jgi:hypothetical protein